ncbi:MAG: nuclear transport factor 2 family protein [Prosthecobacter sp.]
MSPREIVQAFVDRFNAADIDGLTDLYHDDAINHQVALEPVQGRAAIRAMFAHDLTAFKLTCIPENIFEEGDWGILEWKDPLGMRGCGFFQTEDGKIRLQRGYWDMLTFMKVHEAPVDE